ncbi:Nucleotide-sugar transporter [Carpediemonas membranifera]|uniref:Nucleotide-sugar transporter n=1 Tax=Carpediemonas membranifera TaxID=201153 RepID=A0A8J6ATZ4_9EUKA|nr:Nucleotide-sugar transporter [Carpediemonas membranifera]|eukprot:KAG9394576.1 Nucleotide-sugar transporter [Carpediemonas membranifera]
MDRTIGARDGFSNAILQQLKNPIVRILLKHFNLERIGLQLPLLLFTCTVLTIFLSLDVLISYATKNAYGTYDYCSSSVVTYVEFMKICISLFFLLRNSPDFIMEQARAMSWQLVFLSAVPAILYAINNNLVFLILRYLEPALFQILSNFKIISTAVLMRFVLHKRFTGLHYLTLVLLMLVISWTQYVPSATTKSSRTVGVLLAILYTFNSSFASVFTEYFLKRYSHISVHAQNTSLYFWGVLFNLVYWFAIDRDPVRSNFFSGWTPAVWLLVLTMSCSGLLISIIMKFANNIVKVFCSSASIVLCIYASWLLFGVAVTMQHLFGAMAVGSIIVLYNLLPPAADRLEKLSAR